MYNLKNGRGTFKGLIGECMFKLTNKNLILTRFFAKSKFFQIFGNRLTLDQKRFLMEKWYSLDALEWNYKVNKLQIFEIKTENQKFNVKSSWRKPKMTLATHNLYKHALKLNFQVQIALITLLDNWNYNVKILDFNESNYCIDKPKKYDKIT